MFCRFCGIILTLVGFKVIIKICFHHKAVLAFAYEDTAVINRKENGIMKKSTYESASISVIYYERTDVIATSGDEVIELPPINVW